MNRQNKDQLEKVCQILNGLRDLCILLESPGIKDIFPSIFILMETAAEKAVFLLEEMVRETQENK